MRKAAQREKDRTNRRRESVASGTETSLLGTPNASGPGGDASTDADGLKATQEAALELLRRAHREETEKLQELLREAQSSLDGTKAELNMREQELIPLREGQRRAQMWEDDKLILEGSVSALKRQLEEAQEKQVAAQAEAERLQAEKARLEAEKGGEKRPRTAHASDSWRRNSGPTRRRKRASSSKTAPQRRRRRFSRRRNSSPSLTPPRGVRGPGDACNWTSRRRREKKRAVTEERQRLTDKHKKEAEEASEKHKANLADVDRKHKAQIKELKEELKKRRNTARQLPKAKTTVARPRVRAMLSKKRKWRPSGRRSRSWKRTQAAEDARRQAELEKALSDQATSAQALQEAKQEKMKTTHDEDVTALKAAHAEEMATLTANCDQLREQCSALRSEVETLTEQARARRAESESGKKESGKERATNDGMVVDAPPKATQCHAPADANQPELVDVLPQFTVTSFATGVLDTLRFTCERMLEEQVEGFSECLTYLHSAALKTAAEQARRSAADQQREEEQEAQQTAHSEAIGKLQRQVKAAKRECQGHEQRAAEFAQEVLQQKRAAAKDEEMAQLREKLKKAQKAAARSDRSGAAAASLTAPLPSAAHRGTDPALEDPAATLLTAAVEWEKVALGLMAEYDNEHHPHRPDRLAHPRAKELAEREDFTDRESHLANLSTAVERKRTTIARVCKGLHAVVEKLKEREEELGLFNEAVATWTQETPRSCPTIRLLHTKTAMATGPLRDTGRTRRRRLTRGAAMSTFTRDAAEMLRAAEAASPESEERHVTRLGERCRLTSFTAQTIPETCPLRATTKKTHPITPSGTTKEVVTQNALLRRQVEELQRGAKVRDSTQFDRLEQMQEELDGLRTKCDAAMAQSAATRVECAEQLERSGPRSATASTPSWRFADMRRDEQKELRIAKQYIREEVQKVGGTVREMVDAAWHSCAAALEASTKDANDTTKSDIKQTKLMVQAMEEKTVSLRLEANEAVTASRMDRAEKKSDAAHDATSRMDAAFLIVKETMDKTTAVAKQAAAQAQRRRMPAGSRSPTHTGGVAAAGRRFLRKAQGGRLRPASARQLPESQTGCSQSRVQRSEELAEKTARANESAADRTVRCERLVEKSHEMVKGFADAQQQWAQRLVAVEDLRDRVVATAEQQELTAARLEQRVVGGEGKVKLLAERLSQTTKDLQHQQLGLATQLEGAQESVSRSEAVSALAKTEVERSRSASAAGVGQCGCRGGLHHHARDRGGEHKGRRSPATANATSTGAQRRAKQSGR
ncbi:plectin-like [Bactrocera neohumeralis]|uniref:plectin-like n=1 Tax=Bactrocera neohumeralis TaxID=98809 RepID=UPI00216672D2|nr:plectin-like [Bactrocera neohumeralis]